MPEATSAQGIVIAAQASGLNFKDPLASMDLSYSPWMVNVVAENRYLRLRNGMKKWAYLDNNIVSNFYILGVYPGSTDKIIGIGTDNTNYYAYDLTATSSTPPVITNVTASFTGASQYKCSSAYFNHNLFFFSGSTTQGARYDGSSFTTIAYTLNGSPFSVLTSAVYKGRLYMIQVTSRSYVYTDIQAVQGACTQVDLSTVISSGSALSWVATFSTVDGIVNQEYIAFGTDSGEVIIFNGDYPDSTSNWQIVGRFKIGKPLISTSSYSAFIPFENDALILTQTGLVSLRNLFQNGTESALSRTVSSYIDDFWVQLAAANNGAWWGVFYPDKRKIVIITSGIIDKYGVYNASGRTFFVLNTITGSWSMFSNQIGPLAGYTDRLFYQAIYANRNVYYGYASTSSGVTSTGIYKYEVPAVYIDDLNNGDTINYNFEIDSAWGSLGNQVIDKKVDMVETFVYSDLYHFAGYLQMALSTDFGREVSNNCEVNPAIGNGYQKLSYGTGGEGVFFQSQIIGASNAASTLGYQLFSTNIILEPGGPMS